MGVKGNKAKAVKPVAVCRWVIDLLLPPGGLPLDPFCGTGSIALGGIRLDGTGVGGAGNSTSRYVGMDVDPVWLGVAEKRLAAYRDAVIAGW